MLAERQRRNEAFDLTDCLQFGDKTTIVLKNKRLRVALGFEKKPHRENGLKNLRNLRDELAHAQESLQAVGLSCLILRSVRRTSLSGRRESMQTSLGSSVLHPRTNNIEFLTSVLISHKK